MVWQIQLDSVGNTLRSLLNIRAWTVLASLQQSQQFLSSGQSALELDRGQCPNSPLSCHNSTLVEDLCCFEAPGGTLLLTQFWDAKPATGPEDSWTLHGLWPDNCDGSYEAYCDDQRNYHNLSGILEASGRLETLHFMQRYWKDYKGDDESFWRHEFNKHATCVSTLKPSCFQDYTPADEVGPFFDRAVSLFKGLPSYQWLEEAGIVPSHTKTYTSAEIQAALSKHFDGRQVRLGCHYGQLNELWYFHNVRGSVQTGDFVPTDLIGSRSTCPSSGIKYLPKVGNPVPTHSTSVLPRPTDGPKPGRPFIGRGQLHVSTSGNGKGCIISTGAWYASGTCASFTSTVEDEGMFKLKSSKGYCGIRNNEFVCGRGAKASLFEASDNKLLLNGSSIFYADEIPGGRRKSIVYTDPGHDHTLQVVWSK